MKKLAWVLFLLNLFTFSTPPTTDKNYYRELYRPQFHFSVEKNWQNAPTGLINIDGEYHLFYQYNPTGNEPGNIHWGHAVSTDLIHWKHLPIALYPDECTADNDSPTVRSGSVLLDSKNLLGKQEGSVQTLVMFYTSDRCGQRIAFSTDQGHTWYKFEGNPVIEFNDSDEASDPMVVWHEPSQKYIMVLSRKSPEERNLKGVSFYTSDNLTDWKYKSHIIGFTGNPDLIQMQVSNRPEESKWVLFDGDGSYLIGDFNGENFVPETAKMQSDFGRHFHAPRTGSNIAMADGKVVQLACLSEGEYPGMPFNGQMTFPTEVNLTKFSFGYKLTRTPIKEIESLHSKQYEWNHKKLIPGINQNIVKKVKGDCLHIKGEFDLMTCSNFGFFLRNSRKETGIEVQYDVRRGLLSVMGISAPVPSVNNKITLQILLDRTSIEVFANNGQTVISAYYTPNEKATGMSLFCSGGELVVDNLEISKLNSTWEQGK